MIGSSEVNRSIRAVLSPALRVAGFQKVRTRHNWRYLSDTVWALHIKAVGAYFSSVTGFPPMSLVAELGLYYLAFPGYPNVPSPIDVDGLPIPPITHCHTRLSLELQSSQDHLRPATMLPAERRRPDVWWLEPNGSNLDEAIADIRDSVLVFGIPFLLKPYNAREVQLKRRNPLGQGDA